MAWAAIALPIAAQLLGGMGKKDGQQQGPQQPAPPSLGEIFGANDKAFAGPPGQDTFSFSPSPFTQYNGDK
jgi:hypothetical protein